MDNEQTTNGEVSLEVELAKKPHKSKIKTIQLWSPEKNGYDDIPYLPISYIYKTANAIFGPLGYDVDIVSVDDSLEIVRTVKKQQVTYVIIKAKVSVTVRFGGKRKTVSAVGCIAYPKSSYAASIDGIVSKACALATKKCFKNFGPVFGQDLGMDDDIVEKDMSVIMEAKADEEVKADNKTKKEVDDFIEIIKEISTQEMLDDAVAAAKEMGKDPRFPRMSLIIIKRKLEDAKNKLSESNQ